MKNAYLFSSFFFALIFPYCLDAIGKNTYRQNNGQEIVQIKIIDKTFDHYYMNGRRTKDTVLTSANTIEKFKIELSALKEVHNLNTRHSMGEYQVTILYANKKKLFLGVIYSIYDGVIIFDYYKNRMYKNDKLEQLISPYFISNNYK
jgi:hypothetical protein